MTGTGVPTWEVGASGGLETAWVRLSGGRLTARGRVLGTLPRPYQLSYELETGPRYVTRRLTVTVRDESGVRRLDLRRSEDGRWSAGGRALPELAGADDCDLGLSPLTNTMPVLRYGLHREPGERRLLMAWVSVPDLAVRANRQTYTHLSAAPDGGGLVRYASGAFTADIAFDASGLVTDYPGLARRRVA